MVLSQTLYNMSMYLFLTVSYLCDAAKWLAAMYVLYAAYVWVIHLVHRTVCTLAVLHLCACPVYCSIISVFTWRQWYDMEVSDLACRLLFVNRSRVQAPVFMQWDSVNQCIRHDKIYLNIDSISTLTCMHFHSFRCFCCSSAYTNTRLCCVWVITHLIHRLIGWFDHYKQSVNTNATGAGNHGWGSTIISRCWKPKSCR